MDDLGCPKTQDLADPEADEEISIFSSYPFRHMTTLHCAEGKRKRKLLGNWAMQQLKL